MALTSPNGRLSLNGNAKDGLTLSYELSFPSLEKSFPGVANKLQNLSEGIAHNMSEGVPLLTIHEKGATAIGQPTEHSVGYWMKTGKRKWCSNRYVEQLYRLAGGDTLAIRLYDDGMVWKRNGKSTVRLDSPSHYWLSEWSEAYEGLFPKDGELKRDKRYAYPALAEYPDDVFLLLTESGITARNAATSMYYAGDQYYDLQNTVAKHGPVFELRPDGPENGGWHTAIVGKLSDVVESTLVTDNSEECVLPDASWVEPGVAAWVYWAYNHGSNDYDIIKRYVDLAAELKLPYVLIDAEWDEMKNGKRVEDAVAYAVERGVKPMIWYNSSIGWVNGAPGPKYRLNKPEDLEREFAWCEDIGVKGVKIDFFSGDTNRNLSFMKELLDAAARHKLLVNFHGATIPRGWQRTYPNFITNEGVYGAEWYNNVPTFTDKAAAHNATLPFTRNVVASMDYTPCAFTDSQHPHITTDAHELALTALFESGIQHLADRPESFLAQPQEVKDYLSQLPTAWDETLLLDGYPGDYVIMARRAGEKWWIAAINGSDSPRRGMKLDSSRLGLDLLSRSLRITAFEDEPEGNGKSWKISRISRLPSTIDLLPRGGALFVVE